MICIKSPLLYLLPTLLIATFFALSGEASQFQHQQILQFQADDNEFGVVLWGERRLTNNDALAENTSLVLAGERTHRRDPSDHLKHYKGGWNFSNSHYVYSVGFTAAPLFIIAALWFLGFGLFLIIITLYCCCCRRRRYGYSQTAYVISLILLALFTISAVIGCIVLYTGQERFHDKTTDTLRYVVDQATFTVDKLMNVSETLEAAKGIGVDQISLPSTVLKSIDKVGTKINASATTLEEKTQENTEDILDVLQSMRLFLITIAAVMLLLAFLGFMLSIFGLQVLVYILVAIGWILVTLTFILCGIFLVFHNVTGDTCVAMDQWVQNPAASTALDKILPCVDNAIAQETLSQTKDVTSQLIVMVNTFITSVSNLNFPANFTPTPETLGTVYYNQSGPSMPALCNPLNPDMTDRECTKDEVEMNKAGQLFHAREKRIGSGCENDGHFRELEMQRLNFRPTTLHYHMEVWKSYICQVSDTGICTNVGRLTPKFYDEMMGAVNLSYALNQYGPFLVELQDCSFVRVTFSDIVKDHCPDLRLYSKQIYVGLTLASSAVMLSLIFWVVYARERRHRVYTKQQQQFTLLVDAQDASRGDHQEGNASTEIQSVK